MDFTLSRRLRLLCRGASLYAIAIAMVSVLLFLSADDLVSKALSEHESPDQVFSGVGRILAAGLFVMNWVLRFVVFVALARLLWVLGRGDVFTLSAARAALLTGRAQLALGILMWATPTLMRLIRGVRYGEIQLMLSMSSTIASGLLFGVVLWLLAKIYGSAVQAVEENRQFV